MLLEVKDLRVHFSQTPFKGKKNVLKAVDGVSFGIKEGEITGLVGESGCGKSTLSRAVMQLIKPTEGSVKLQGVELTELSPMEVRSQRLNFQMIFQDPYASLNPRMTVFSTLSEALQRRKGKQDKDQAYKAVAELMELVGLNAQQMRKYPHEFSGGQRQRIAIARALAPKPRLIIADEPVSALDVSVQSQILNLLLKLRDELKLTMLFISHDLSVVRYLADQILVMYKGEIVEKAKTEQLFEKPKHEYTKKLLNAVPQIKTAATAS